MTTMEIILTIAIVFLLCMDAYIYVLFHRSIKYLRDSMNARIDLINERFDVHSDWIDQKANKGEAPTEDGSC